MAPRKLTTEEWIEYCKKIHVWKPEEIRDKNKYPDGTPKYDYSITKYINSNSNIEYICPLHGKQIQNAGHHKNGIGCKKCGIESKIRKVTKSNNDWIKEAKAIHDPLRDSLGLQRYDYSNTKYKHSENFVEIYCPECKEYFKILACNHLQGSGCKKCGTKRQKEKCQKTIEQFIQEAKTIHDSLRDSFNLPRYDYSNVKQFSNMVEIIETIKCPIHGFFPIQPHHHLISKQGCKQCSIDLNSKLRTKSSEQFIQEAKEIHDQLRDNLNLTRYDYSITNYEKSSEYIDIICPIHGKFTVKAGKHLYELNGCPDCNRNVSKSEFELRLFLKQNDINFSTNNRNIITPNELDIYIPENKIAIEFNGLYWHSEKFKSDFYHLLKTEACEKQGIQLIHIFEDEWLEKQEIVKSRLLNILGKSKWKIGARKCIIKQVTSKEERNFLETNHLQGYIASSLCYGLYYNNKDNNKEYLVSLMSFGNLRKNLGSEKQDNVYEMYRFCNAKYFNIQGAASKLFKYFIKRINPKQVISYADRRYSINSSNNLYKQLGFEFDSYSKPGYFYVNGNTRINRFALRKDILISKYNCPNEKSEHQFCLENNLFRIYDCGQIKYVWEN